MLSIKAAKIFIKHLTICLVLAGTVFSVYRSVLRADFLLWDDRAYVTENEVVFTPLDQAGLSKIFRQKVSGSYVPLTVLSYALEYRLWGDSASVHHATNLILHLLNTLLVYFLALRMGLSLWPALLAACLFALHPMRVESVAWIAQRKDVLYSFFFLSAMLCYESRGRTMGAVNGQVRRWGAYVLVHLLGILSVLAHPMAAGLPLILLLIDRFQGRKINRAAFLEKVPLFLVLAAISYLTLSSAVAGSRGHLVQTILIICWSTLFYLRQYVIPVVMVPIVRLPVPVSYTNPEYIWSGVALLIVLLCVTRLRKSRWVFFSAGFFLCSLLFLVVSGLMKNLSFAADRFMYLPGMGFCLLSGAGIQWVLQRWEKRTVLSVVVKSVSFFTALFLCFAMAAVTYRQTYVWQNDVALWRHQLANYPNEPIALNGLAVALREYDDFVVAEKEYRKMVSVVGQGYELRMDEVAQEHVRRVHYIINLMQRAKLVAPDLAEIPYKLGRYYQALGLYANAVAEYRTAVDVDPGFKDVYLSLGRIYLDLKDLDKAALAFGQFCVLRPVQEKDFLKVVETYAEYLNRDPENISLRSGMFDVVTKYIEYINQQALGAESYVNLGMIYVRIGDNLQARQAFERAVALNPRQVTALYALGVIQLEAGARETALEYFENVVKLDARSADALLKIGNIRYSQGEILEARRYYRQAIAVNPKHAQAHFNLGYTFEETGKLTEAATRYQMALHHDPLNADAHFNLGNVYLKLDKPSAAVNEYLKTVEQNPDYLDAWVNLAVTSYNAGDRLKAKKYYEEAVLLGFQPTPEMLRQFGAIR